jgi:hypothetical protein
MIDPQDLDFANALSMKDAGYLCEALDAALTAMAHFGSEVSHMQTVSALHLVARREAAEAFKSKEMMFAPRLAEQST